MKVVYISHDAGIFGATKCALTTLKYLANNSHIELRIVIRSDLCNSQLFEFQNLGEVFEYRAFSESRDESDDLLTNVKTYGYRRTLNRKIHEIKMRTRRRKWRLDIGNWKPDLIYSNTIINGDVIEFLRLHDTPVVVHVHELHWYFRFLGKVQLDSFVNTPKNYFAVSSFVKDNLINNFGVSENDVHLVPPPIDQAEIVCQSEKLSDEQVRLNLGVSPETVLVGVIGLAHEMKGTQLFVDTIKEISSLPESNGDLVFVWIGEGPEIDTMKNQLEQVNLSDSARFVDSQSNPYPLIRSLDILYACSKEESFGRTPVEAALFQIPSLAFEDAKGPTEFIDETCGAIIPGFSVREAASTIRLWSDDTALRAKLGAQAKSKALSNYSIAHIGRLVTTYLDQIQSGRIAPNPHSTV